MSPTDAAPSITDWLSAWGQVAGSVATLAAVVLALWIARRDGRRIDKDRVDEAIGQAAMVMAEPQMTHVVIINHGTRPISTPRVVGFTIDGLSDLTWRATRSAPAAIVLGPGEKADASGHFWESTGPGGERQLPPSGLRERLGADDPEIEIVIEFFDSSGRQ